MTSDMDHHELRMSLGAYVLGHLEAGERARVEAHLRGCADCRSDVTELRPVAEEMAHVAVPLSKGAPTPPAGLGERIEARIAETERRQVRLRFVRSAGVAAVAAAVLAIALVAGLRFTEDPAAPSVPLEAVSIDSQAPGVRAAADLVAHTWGVEVKLQASGFEEGARYRVSVLGADGTSYSAGEFVGTGNDPMACNLNSGVLRDEAVAFEVEDAEGQVVLRSAFDA